MNQIGTRLSENPRFFVLYSSAPPRLVSVHVLAAGHRVVVGGAEIGGRCCYWLVCPLGKQGLVKRICEAFPHPRKKVAESLSGQVPNLTCICTAPKWNWDPKALQKLL